ncbi:MAG: MraY family glycosyltransferase [Bryobacteraceae bacterium]|jgi:UDP-GlcNAc:undecaprenyl-phosphate GlcNAc-1-phosphate transferase
MGELLWVAAKAFLIALVLTPIIRDVFRAYNVVDRPGRRKVHAFPIPRVGGIAIAVAYSAAFLSFSDFSNSLPAHDSPLWKLLPGAAVVFLTGLLDDFFTLRPAWKLIGQIAAGALVFFNGLRIEAVSGLSLPVWVSLPLTVLWLLLCSNAFNLIDGLDGLCAGMGFVATLALFAAALIQNNVALAHATFPLAGALLGFLCYNFNPATVFLGDSGALLIGFLLGGYGMIWTEKTATLLSVTVPLLALSIPLLDVSLSIVRRFLRRQPIFSADRGHIHHRLLDLGLSPRSAVLFLYLFGMVAASFALLLSHPLWAGFQGVLIVLFGLIAWAGIWRLRYAEFEVAGRLLFGGEFQRALGAKVRTTQLAAALQRCRSEEEWWTALLNAARDAGCIRLCWSGAHGDREHVLAPGLAAWSFHVILSERESVQLEGALPAAGPPVDLIGFAEALSRSLTGKRREWEQPALP